jgi:hypothetical protein
VYLTLAEQYPQQKFFKLIAARAEQIHTSSMRDQLEMFNLPDPDPNSDNFPDTIGVFAGIEWGWYFTEQYEFLTDKSMISDIEALYVSAYIEELDMKNIKLCPEVMIESGYPSPCGLAYTSHKDLQRAYRSLLHGSEEHLRRIETVIGERDYEAQYLTQAEVDAILGR